ncbi:hypothetical protein BDN72DRAFT_837201 [Pluteus cervinus]|uniref:Uncharacterized protein n=1 Tax=Pluteus cervinus TaxID=181527 RepID=A0ACD3B1H4_9AGAR|nr:hypothetical protein BDN72DRAFT_837201 [Pluteus cervinus]
MARFQSSGIDNDTSPTPDPKPAITSPPTRFQLPGFGLPLNYLPRAAYSQYEWDRDLAKSVEVFYEAIGIGKDLLPTMLNSGHIQSGDAQLPMTTLREFTIMRLLSAITDKPDWEKKVFDEVISKKWKQEALAIPGLDVSEKMIDWAIEEARYKSKLPLFVEHGAICVYDGDVVKSDTVIPQSVKEALQRAVAPLEDVPENKRDWHPGSNEQVLDLVHPSLFPLVYGKSRILPDSLTGLEDFAKRCGEGAMLPVPPENEAGLANKRDPWAYGHGQKKGLYSQKFQWLPCDVDISGERAKITSYINNLHPQQHPEVYRIIEDIITHLIPLWNASLTPLRSRPDYKRISCSGPEFHPIAEEDYPQQMAGEDENDYWDRRQNWERDTRELIRPEPTTFSPPSRASWDVLLPGELKPEKVVDLKREFGDRGLQVIVKLANIHLTPEKPSYPGGTWHVEGQLNEHICASAIYYYDNDNISSSSLTFRQLSSESDCTDMNYEQDDHDWLPVLFGCEQHGTPLQNIGGVETKEGRVITFPNILQHQVQSFQLADPTRPGHRKILALFLVDPHIRVISTANVPCQRRDWWSQTIQESAYGGTEKDRTRFNQLPVELMGKVVDEVEDFPISLEEAKKLREELMEERKAFVVAHQNVLNTFEISLCEH